MFVGGKDPARAYVCVRAMSPYFLLTSLNDGQTVEAGLRSSRPRTLLGQSTSSSSTRPRYGSLSQRRHVCASGLTRTWERGLVLRAWWIRDCLVDSVYAAGACLPACIFLCAFLFMGVCGCVCTLMSRLHAMHACVAMPRDCCTVC